MSESLIAYPFSKIVQQRRVTAVPNNTPFLYTLYYYINTEGLYPFLEFLVQYDAKFQHYNLPVIQPSSAKLHSCILKQIRHINPHFADQFEFHGVTYVPSMSQYLALVHIKAPPPFTPQSLYRMVTGYEIINTRAYIHVPIDAHVCQLFTLIPEISILTNSEKKGIPLPSIMYSVSKEPESKFSRCMGSIRKQRIQGCGSYYFMYTTAIQAYQVASQYMSSGVNICINRHAVFVSNFDIWSSASIHDEDIVRHPDKYILLQTEDKSMPNVIVHHSKHHLQLDYIII